MPDFIDDEEFILETDALSVWLFTTDETFEALLASDIENTRANTIKIVFIVIASYLLLYYDSNVQWEKPNEGYRHVNALLKFYRTSLLLNIFTYPKEIF